MPIPGPGATSGATFKFVDSIAASPATRLDLNDGAIWLLEVGSDFSPPGLKESYADTILNDGALPSASAYTNRRLGLRLSLAAASEDVKATQLRLLHVELNRESNILMYQPGSTPLFFRTFRSPGYRLTETETPAYTTVDLDIEAEPFAYGLRVDQAGVSVKTDPALTNGCYLDVNSVTGDVETPAYITLSNGTVTSPSADATNVLAVRRRGTPSSLVHLYQPEAGTLGADTTVVVGNDATASGSGNNTARTTFASDTSFAFRTSIANTEGTEVIGTYRVLARVKKSVAGDTITMGASILGVTPSSSSRVTLGATTSWQLVDLGLIQVPFTDPSLGFSGTTYTVKTAGFFSLWAGRSSGSGNLTYDFALLIPADENYMAFGTLPWYSTNSLVVDGPQDTFHLLSSGQQNPAANVLAVAGAAPSLRPGSNRVYFVQGLSKVAAPALTETSDLTVSYWPRYLVV